MRLKITTTVDFDHKAWAREYGLNPDDRSGIGEDIRTYLEQQAYCCPAVENGLLKLVEQ